MRNQNPPLQKTKAKNARVSRLRAYALLQGSLDQQSILYSYVDDFRYFVIVCALCLPLVFLVKPAKTKRGAAPAGH